MKADDSDNEFWVMGAWALDTGLESSIEAQGRMEVCPREGGADAQSLTVAYNALAVLYATLYQPGITCMPLVLDRLRCKHVMCLTHHDI